MPTSTPFGRAGRGRVGRGRVSVGGADRATSACPEPPIASAAAPVPPRATTRRRVGCVGSAWAEPEGSTRATSRSSVRIPTTAATRAGSQARSSAVGRSTAAAPARPVSSRRSSVEASRERGRTVPARAARSRETTATEPMRIGLSAVPKVPTAHSLTGVGVASMTWLPTARTGDDAGEVRAATRCAAAVPRAAARMPQAAGRADRELMDGVRRCPGWRMGRRQTPSTSTSARLTPVIRA